MWMAIVESEKIILLNIINNFSLETLMMPLMGIISIKIFCPHWCNKEITFSLLFGLHIPNPSKFVVHLPARVLNRNKKTGFS